MAQGRLEFITNQSIQGELQLIAARRIQDGFQAAAKSSWYTDFCSLLSLRETCSGDQIYDSLFSSWIRFGQAMGLDQSEPSGELCA